MSDHTMKITKSTITLLVLLCSSIYAIGQAKIEKIKINGLLEEWPNLQNNKSTGSYYTFYNDDKNFYIALKFTDDVYIKKVLAGGITLSINTNGKKNIQDSYQIAISPTDDYRTTRQFSSTPLKLDSATQAHRKTSLTKTKELKLSGFTQIPDSIISIYNTYGIKMGAKADDKAHLNYELSIPLEQLSITLNKKTELAVNIQFNAVNFRSNRTNPSVAPMAGMRTGTMGNKSAGGVARTPAPKSTGYGNADLLLLSSANDFWDKYKIQ